MFKEIGNTVDGEKFFSNSGKICYMLVKISINVCYRLNSLILFLMVVRFMPKSSEALSWLLLQTSRALLIRVFSTAEIRVE